jgi:hypothetical protein
VARDLQQLLDLLIPDHILQCDLTPRCWGACSGRGCAALCTCAVNTTRKTKVINTKVDP